MLAIERTVEASEIPKRQLSGRIRFALSPNGGDRAILGPVMEFMRLHPGVIIETIPSVAFEDVAAGAADIAFRAGPRPDDSGLIVRKVGEVFWQPCCSKSYAEEFGIPETLEDLRRHKVIGAEGQLAQAVPFRRFHELAGPCELRAISLDAVSGYVRVGAGVSILPEVTIAAHGEIIPCLPALEDAPSETWIITREDIRKTPQVRAFLDLIIAHLSGLLRRPVGDRTATRPGNPNKLRVGGLFSESISSRSGIGHF